MPIRTHRGRAAVYRRLWGWPLRSPRHLAGTIVVFIALVVAAGIAAPKLFADGEGGGTAAPTESTETSAGGDDNGRAAPPTSPLPTRLTEPQETPTSAPPEPAALQVAAKWAAAWVNHPPGMTNPQWLEGLRPYTTPEYLPTLSSVDPANIPADRVTGDPAPGNSFTSSLEAIVPTDGPKLSITVVRTNEGWRVAHYEQAG